MTEINALFFPKNAKIYAYVRPRYTPGSGAMVTDAIALRVAEQERSAYQFIAEGFEGEAAKQRAELLGLRGISYIMAERGSGKQFRWMVQDLVTGECYCRHHDTEIEKMGFTAFRNLSEAAKAQVDRTGRPGDYERSWWRQDARTLTWAQYEVELWRGL